MEMFIWRFLDGSDLFRYLLATAMSQSNGNLLPGYICVVDGPQIVSKAFLVAPCGFSTGTSRNEFRPQCNLYWVSPKIFRLPTTRLADRI